MPLGGPNRLWMLSLDVSPPLITHHKKSFIVQGGRTITLVSIDRIYRKDAEGFKRPRDSIGLLPISPRLYFPHKILPFYSFAGPESSLDGNNPSFGISGLRAGDKGVTTNTKSRGYLTRKGALAFHQSIQKMVELQAKASCLAPTLNKCLIFCKFSVILV